MERTTSFTVGPPAEVGDRATALFYSHPPFRPDSGNVEVPVTVANIGGVSPISGMAPVTLIDDETGAMYHVAGWVWTDRIHNGLHTHLTRTGSDCQHRAACDPDHRCARVSGHTGDHCHLNHGSAS